MPASSIVFSPELDERQLDRETDSVNEQLQDVGRDLPLTFDGDLPEMEGGISPAGGGGGRGAPGGAGAAAGLASRIPKPVAGVSAAAALPVALSGAIGVGMLSKMTETSARMGTSATILSQAYNQVWASLGDQLDQLFVRDAVMGLAEDFRGTADAIRSGEFLSGANQLFTGIDDEDSLAESIGSVIGGAGGAAAGIKAGGAAGAAAGSVIPGAGTAAGAIVGAVVGGIGGLFAGSRIGSTVSAHITSWWDSNIPSFSWPSLPEFSWPTLPRFRWPDLPAFSWPSLPTFEWPSPRSILGEFDAPTGADVVDSVFGGINIGAGMLIDAVTGGGGGGGGGGDDDGGILPFDIPGLATGGRVERSGVARVHRGELVADPDRLVNDLASAIGASGGGGGTDTARVEDKLDTLIREIRRMRQGGGDVVLQTPTGREVSRAQRRASETDPRAR